MRTIILEPGTRQQIGRSGDTGVTVQFRALPWHQAYPAGLPYLMVTAPGGARIPVTVTYADGLISGEVPDELLVRPGLYSYEFSWVSAGEQVQSSPCGAVVLDGETSKRWNPHCAAPDWADRIFLAAESIERKTDGVTDAAEAAQEAQAEAETAQAGAEAAQDGAETAQSAAEAAQAAAEAAADNAQDYADAVDAATVEETLAYMDMDGSATPADEVAVSGANPVIKAGKNTFYVCGELQTLSFTPNAKGISAVRFTSGTTATILTVPNTVKWPVWFDAGTLETNKIYELSIMDGVYGAVMVWQ